MEWFEKLYTQNFVDLCGFADPEQTEREAKFVVEALQLTADSNLLDLCCGFGRHCHAISNICQCSITGLDLSDEFLAIANAQYSAPTVKYLKGDMREVPFEGVYDAVSNLFTSFGFFRDDAENELVLREVRDALKPGGLFLLDYENKFWFVRNDVLANERSWSEEDGTHYLLENRYDVTNEREVFEATIIRQGKVVDRVGYDIRLYSLPELRAMLERSGFALERTWGEFDGRPYSVHSRRLITLSRKV